MANDNFPLSVGSSGPKVEQLQESLGAAVDGNFGPGTELKVNAYIATNFPTSPQNGIVTLQLFNIIVDDPDSDIPSLPPQPLTSQDDDSPSTSGILPYVDPDDQISNPGPIVSGSIGFGAIKGSIGAANQLAGGANQVGGAIEDLADSLGFDLDLPSIPSLSLETVFNLMGIDLEEYKAEFLDLSGINALQSTEAGSFAIQGIQAGIGQTTASLDTSSLDPFKELPKNIEFGFVTGTVVDGKDNRPLPGVKVRNILLKKATTNEKGEFTIPQPIIPPILKQFNIISPNQLKLTFSLKKFTDPTPDPPVTYRYSPKIVTPYTSTGKLKGYTKDELPNKGVGIVKLNRIESDFKEEIQKFLKFPDDVVDNYTTTYATYEFTLQKELNKAVSNLKGIAIPLILTLIASYGVSKISDIIDAKKNEGITGARREFDKVKDTIENPSKEDLDKLIATKNKLVKTINGTLKVIEVTTKTLAVTGTLINLTDTAYKLLKNVPTPTAIAGVGIPISVVNNIEDAKIFLANNIGKYKHINNTSLSILKLLELALGTVLDLLEVLDLFVQYSYETTGLKPNDEEGIDPQLQALTQQETQQKSPIVTNVNGFEMDIEIEKTTNKVKRRRAIARNKAGVVMLKGEYSFSSIDQILIDQLVFYIQQNDLKAD